MLKWVWFCFVFFFLLLLVIRFKDKLQFNLWSCYFNLLLSWMYTLVFIFEV